MSAQATTQNVPQVYSGSCLCKEVQYELKGKPFTFHVCHCVNCKKGSGSAFMANAFFKSEQLTIVKGDGSIKVYNDEDTLSRTPIARSFCANCGSSLFLRPGKAQGFVIVPTGTIDGPIDWVPRKENFCDGRRDWVEIIRPTGSTSPSSKL